MYNDETESWWIPFQSLWFLEDKEWMKERRTLWKCIKKNIDEDGGLPSLELSGLRNFFTTGYQYKKPPPSPDYDGVARRMGVKPQQRLVLAPFTCESHYRDFVLALPDGNKHRRIAEVMSAFHFIVLYFKNTDQLEIKFEEIYQYVLGGGSIYDNALLLRDEQALKVYELPYQLNEYFFCISALLQLHSDEERPEYWAYERLFDYYTSFADYINENPQQFNEYNYDFRDLYFRYFKKPRKLADKKCQALYDRSRDFIFSGRLPEEMRVA